MMVARMVTAAATTAQPCFDMRHGRGIVAALPVLELSVEKGGEKDQAMLIRRRKKDQAMRIRRRKLSAQISGPSS